MKMTRDLLSALGSCGTYVNTFDRLFPIEEYPDGVEVTADVCVANCDEFDWSWAAEVMLTAEAYRTWCDAVYYKNSDARAQMFGELVTVPDNHNEKIDRVQERADRNATDRERDEIRNLEARIADAKRLVESLPTLEEQLTTLTERHHVYETARLRRRIQRAEAKIAVARAAHDALEAELAALVATQTESTAESVDA